MALSGVRSSWDMLARNSDLCRLATSSWLEQRRAFWMASADWVAKVRSSSMVSGGKSPGAFRVTARPPSRRPSRSMGTASSARMPASIRVSRSRPSYAPATVMSGTCAGSSVTAVRPTHALAFADPRGAPSLGERAAPACPVAARCTNSSARLVVLEDDAAVQPRELDGARDDGREHRLQVERRADGLADLAERGELAHGAGELGRARLQLAEQARVLDGDDRLVGERLEQRDLGSEKRAGAVPDGPADDADDLVLPEHRTDRERQPRSGVPRDRRSAILSALDVTTCSTSAI